eukprot:5578441-Pleurochrysis_carterae.AAC.1
MRKAVGGTHVVRGGGGAALGVGAGVRQRRRRLDDAQPTCGQPRGKAAAARARISCGWEGSQGMGLDWGTAKRTESGVE